MIAKFVLSLLLLSSSLFSKECKVDDRIMFSIATTERHPKTPIGYPYLISINLKKDQKEVAKDPNFKKLMLDRRTIDCEFTQQCVVLLSALIDRNITNLDLGSYQLNFHYWKMATLEDYFNAGKSYAKACDIVMFHNRDEWSWKNIAKYHSKTKRYNNAYKEKILSNISRSL